MFNKIKRIENIENKYIIFLYIRVHTIRNRTNCRLYTLLPVLSSLRIYHRNISCLCGGYTPWIQGNKGCHNSKFLAWSSWIPILAICIQIRDKHVIILHNKVREMIQYSCQEDTVY